MNITKISIKRPTIVVVIFTILIALGLFTYSKLNYELLPKISSPVLSITTVYPGASPYEVENSVTKEIEDAVSSLEGIDKITSTSMESVSIVTVELDEATNVDLALQDATRKINAIEKDLPEDIDPPSLGKFDLDDLPIMRLGVRANMSGTELYDLVDKKIQPQLAKLKGVAQVSILGGEEREIRINIDADKLKTYGISILQVSQAIQNANLDFPTGKIKDKNNQTIIRLTGKYTSLDQMRDLVISTRQDGSEIRLQDVAEVQDSKKDVEMISRINGEDAIGLSIQKQSDANAVDLSAAAKKTMGELEKEYADQGLAFSIASDSADFTLEAANAVIHDLLFAVILVALVMLLFLHSLRNAVIVMIAVPASIISTFTAMYVLGFTLNLMTLLGLSLVVGILVDDAIVVIENIYRHMEMGKNRLQAAYDGIREIGMTVTSITLVIVAVFFPLSLSTGIIGNILRQFSLVVAISTLLSLFVAFTMIPLLASRFSKVQHITNKGFIGKIVYGFERLLTRFEDSMTNALKWSFNHKALLLGGTLALFIASFALVGGGFIGSEFTSQGDRGEFMVDIELPKSATIEQNNFTTREIEKFIAQYPEVITISSTVGQSSGAMGSTNATPNETQINVKMVEKEKRNVSTEVFARRLKIALEENIVGAKIKTSPVGLLGTANQAPIQIQVSGTELDTVMKAANTIMNIVRSVNGTAEVETSTEDGNPEIEVEVDRDKMAQLGLSLEMVGATMQTAFNGVDQTQYRDGENEYDINIQLDEFDRKNIKDISMLPLVNNRGETVYLGQFANITEGTGPSQLERRDKIPTVTVNSQVIGRPVGTVGTEIGEKLKDLDLPAGVSYNMGGDLERQKEAFGSLFLALFASMFLVYLIMVALYNSYAYPLVVMFSLPLAVIGALLALALTKQTLSIFSILGMIMLIGLVAKNAILVVDFTNQLKAAGLKVKDALIKATQTRIRPILMTTIAMVIGMLPIALASGAGAEWKNGLAWVLIGGLTSSMFLTLVVVPVIYYLFDLVLARFGWDKEKHIELKDTPREELNTEIEESLKAERERQLEYADYE